MALVKFIAQTFNSTHKPIFPIPQPHVGKSSMFSCLGQIDHALSKSKVPSNRIVNLQKPTAKMSKSHPSPLSRIYITDSPSDIRAKIQAAIVERPDGDGSLEITYDPILRPGLSNLLVVWSAFDDESREPSELAELAGKDAWTIEHLKKQVAEVIIRELEPVRVKYERIRGDSAFLRQVAERNKRVAQATACKTMAEIRAVLGLNSI
jgi:tryptophanyl-tRNA synthetase